MFNDWCDIDERAHGEKKKLCGLSERAGGRAAIKEELVERVRSHYDKLEQIAEDVDRLGFPRASAILRERLPSTARERSGEMGEIIATEFIEYYTGFRVPVRRLRYKDGRNMALRGDDYVGIADDEEPRLLFLKGEAKSGRAVPRGVVADARERLSENDGHPTTISLLFVADRLLESVEEADKVIGRRIRDEVGLGTIQPRRITHGLFALSGNSTEAILEADLEEADGAHNHLSVSFRVDGHPAFIDEIYEEASELGDD